MPAPLPSVATAVRADSGVRRGASSSSHAIRGTGMVLLMG
jgi:hypothetical protein